MPFGLALLSFLKQVRNFHNKILQNLYYMSIHKKAGNSNQDLMHAATLLFRDVTYSIDYV